MTLPTTLVVQRHGYGTSADGRRFFKNAGDQIVTHADQTIT